MSAVLRIVEGGAGAAPYPPETRSRGWYFPLDMGRVRQSKAWALAGAVLGLRNVLLRVWCESWEQIPMGSWPDDDPVIAAVVEYPLGMFVEHRAVLMHGWWMAADGRLYHPYITELALGRLRFVHEEAQRKRRWREKQALQQPDSKTGDAMSHGTGRPVTHRDDAGAGAGAGAGAFELGTVSEIVRGRGGRREKSARATRLSKPWVLPEEWKAWAVTIHHLEPDRVVRISLNFRDHWWAKAGKDAAKLDWFATWRKWVRTEVGDA